MNASPADRRLPIHIGRPAWAELADQLADMVVTGALAPGQRLVEAELAAHFGVSRGPVRSALAWLETRGLVENQRRGLAVMRLTVNDVIELYEVRMALEGTAIKAIEGQASVRDLEPLLVCVGDIMAATRRQDRAAVVNADISFHRTLCLLSGNRRLLRAWELLSDQIRLVMGTVQPGHSDEFDPLIRDHQRIYSALLSPDADGRASRDLHIHLANTREAMVELVRQRQGDDSEAARGSGGPAMRSGDRLRIPRQGTTPAEARADATSGIE